MATFRAPTLGCSCIRKAEWGAWRWAWCSTLAHVRERATCGFDSFLRRSICCGVCRGRCDPVAPQAMCRRPPSLRPHTWTQAFPRCLQQSPYHLLRGGSPSSASRLETQSEGGWQPSIAEWTFTRTFLYMLSPRQQGARAIVTRNHTRIATGKRERKWERREKGRGSVLACKRSAGTHHGQRPTVTMHEDRVIAACARQTNE